MLIGVSGNIGSGKTTLAEKLASALNYQLKRESVEDNPYLEDFYKDMAQWAIHTQFHFLGHRMTQHGRADDRSAASAILDRTIYEDGEIFAPTLADFGLISQRDLRSYLRVYEAILPSIRPPDIIVYLRASTDTLLNRIRVRGRPYEKRITKEYLDNLQSKYDQWIERIAFCPTLIVDADKTDVGETNALARLTDQIKMKTSHPENV